MPPSPKPLEKFLCPHCNERVSYATLYRHTTSDQPAPVPLEHVASFLDDDQASELEEEWSDSAPADSFHDSEFMSLVDYSDSEDEQEQDSSFLDGDEEEAYDELSALFESTRFSSHPPLLAVNSSSTWVTAQSLQSHIKECVTELLMNHARYRSSQSSFNSTISTISKLLGFVAPSANNFLPTNHRMAMRAVKKGLCSVNSFVCCPNGCVLYYKDRSHLLDCPTCCEPRYDPGTSLARRRFHHLPLLDHIQTMFDSPLRAYLIRSHSHPEEKSSGQTLSDYFSGQLYHDLQSEFGPSSSIDSSVSMYFGLSVDGACLSQEKQSSIWPITLEVLNLPIQFRKKRHSMLLAGLVSPGPIPSLEVFLGMDNRFSFSI